jgi:hypothetical protein
MSFHSRTPAKAHQPVHDSTLTKATNWGQLVRLAGTRDTNHNGVCQTPAVMAQNLIGGYGHTQQAQLAHKRARPAVSSPPGLTTPAWGNSYQDDAPPSQSKPAAFLLRNNLSSILSQRSSCAPSAILSPSPRFPAPPVLFRPPDRLIPVVSSAHSLGGPPRGSPALVARPSAPRTRTQGTAPSQTRAQPLP